MILPLFKKNSLNSDTPIVFIKIVSTHAASLSCSPLLTLYYFVWLAPLCVNQVPLPPPRRESYHMTHNPPPYSSLVPSGSHTIKSSSSSCYSYSETSRTTTTSSDIAPEANANANSFISQLLGRKVPSLKLANEGSNSVTANAQTSVDITNNTNMNQSWANTNTAKVMNPGSPDSPPSPPPRTHSKSRATTHTASLSIRIASKGSEYHPESGLQLGFGSERQDHAEPRPKVPPRPAGDVAVLHLFGFRSLLTWLVFSNP